VEKDGFPWKRRKAMGKRLALLVLVGIGLVAFSSLAMAQQTVFKVPEIPPGFTAVYLVQVSLPGELTVSAQDCCGGNDTWEIIGIGLPGGVQTGETPPVEGPLPTGCDPEDLDPETFTQVIDFPTTFLALVAVRKGSQDEGGDNVYLRFQTPKAGRRLLRTLAVTQVQGFDACGK